MPKKFEPNFSITPKIARALMRIESVREAIANLPMTPKVLESLRETARLSATHYSTMIEGNRLTQVQVNQVIKTEDHFPGRERDESEVKGYYAALNVLEKMVATKVHITETTIQTLHSLVMGKGKVRVKATPYRDGQNVIRDSRSGSIIYLPPEAHDVLSLMSTFVQWIHDRSDTLPCPIIAGVAHYQFATIHPYFDGNGRTARLLTTLILHLGGYDLKGIYSLDEYYAEDLPSYYEAISIGPSHNYYMGREESEITSWLEYFCEGMAFSFEKVRDQAKQAAKRGEKDVEKLLRKMDPKKRKALKLFRKQEMVTSKEIGALFGFKQRTSSELCRKWVDEGFLTIVNPSKKARTYRLADHYLVLKLHKHN